ncbi:hypothetical protein JTE90_027685 [Oedothorax gibbosus]|uniref:Uncharacterized protein n=1 Tax=Oedothorax gibbosus TaxID=931172 RepID=A0AAV6TK83_9ARAC|nr:hypothetical protein JTE90_027685 [Oedothorax gibbosus]
MMNSRLTRNFSFMRIIGNRQSPARKRFTGYPFLFEREAHDDSFNVARVLPRTSKGIYRPAIALGLVRLKPPPVPLRETKETPD